MTVSGGEILLDLFQSCGVEYIFCSPGTEWTSSWEGLIKRQAKGDNSLKYINCRHEMLAVSMAQGYAEATGRLPAVLLHAGVGSLHGSMAIRNALAAQVPMIICSAETYEHSGEGGVRAQGPHWIGLLSDIGGPAALLEGCAKWSNGIRSIDGLVDSIYRGCRMALTAPRGPVLVSIPIEILQKSFTETRKIRAFPEVTTPVLGKKEIEDTALQLLSSKRPVIIVENASRRAGMAETVTELAELLNIPVFESLFPFCSNISKRNPLYLGLDTTEALKDADTVLVIGGTTPWYPPANCPQPSTKIIWLNEAPMYENLPYSGYQYDQLLVGDIGQSLVEISSYIRSNVKQQKLNGSVYLERLEQNQIKHEKLLESWENEALAEKNKQPVSAKWLFRLAREVFPNNSIIVDETLMYIRLTHRYLAEPERYIRCGYGGLGVGLGEAVGVKLANPDKPVILFIGDGAFNYNPALAGLGMSQEYKLPLLIILINNGGYIAMKMGHNRMFPDGYAAKQNTYLGVNITPAPDYTKIAEAFGAYGEKVERPEDIEHALERGLKQIAGGRTALLDINVGSP